MAIIPPMLWVLMLATGVLAGGPMYPVPVGSFPGSRDRRADWMRLFRGYGDEVGAWRVPL